MNDAPGLQVINWNTQSNFAPSSNRAEVLKSIQRNFGKKPIGDEIPSKNPGRHSPPSRDRLIQSTRKKTDAILWAMREFDWQCFITAYYEGHRAGHNLWPIWEDFASDPPEEAMLDVYREIDAQIGRLLGALDLSNTALVLFSMHGMTAGYGQDHFLPEIMQRINSLYLSKLGHQVAPRRPGLARVLRQTVPGSVQLQHSAARWPDGSGLAGRSRMDGAAKTGRSTPAFPVPTGGDVGFIRLNVQGREREGFLPAEEEASSGYLEFLCRQLQALRIKETNEPLIDEIVLARDAFPGPRSQLLPDVLATWHPDCPATEIWSEDLGTLKATLKTGRGGSHTGDSFALLAGAIGDGLPPLSHIRDYKRSWRNSSLRRDVRSKRARQIGFAAVARRTKLRHRAGRLSIRQAHKAAIAPGPGSRQSRPG